VIEKTARQVGYERARAAIDELAAVNPKIAAALRAVLDEPGCGGECCDDWDAGCNAGITLSAKAIADALTGRAAPSPPPPCYAATGQCDGSCDGLGDPGCLDY
jgi:hypothetical protein